MLPSPILLDFQKILLCMTSNLQKNHIPSITMNSISSHQTLCTENPLAHVDKPPPPYSVHQRSEQHSLQAIVRTLISVRPANAIQFGMKQPTRTTRSPMTHLRCLLISSSGHVTTKTGRHTESTRPHIPSTHKTHCRCCCTCITVLDPTKASIFFQSRSNLQKAKPTHTIITIRLKVPFEKDPVKTASLLRLLLQNLPIQNLASQLRERGFETVDELLA